MFHNILNGGKSSRKFMKFTGDPIDLILISVMKIIMNDFMVKSMHLLELICNVKQHVLNPVW
jgi:hypothetical protein